MPGGPSRVATLVAALAITGFALPITRFANAWSLDLAITALHVIFAIALLALLLPSLWSHVRRYANSGWLVFGTLPILGLTGAALLGLGARGALPTLHAAVGSLLVAFLVWHVTRVRTYNWRGSSLLAGCLIFVAGGALFEFGLQPRLEPAVASELASYGPASMRVRGILPDYHESTMAADTCATCHADIVDQWRQSMHSIADGEIVYARVVAEFRQVHGVQASNWCAGCHSPLRLARGQLNIQVAEVPQANVDCVGCHSIQEIAQPVGNNAFVLQLDDSDPYAISNSADLETRLVLLRPAAHQARFNGSVDRSPEICGGCHRQILPSSLADGQPGPLLQDTYGEWQHSPYNTGNRLTDRTCQSCHMPSDSGLNVGLGNPPSHLFTGGSTDVPRIMGARTELVAAEQLLSRAATLSLQMSHCTEGVPFMTVRVANTGTGHNLPTGVTDLRQIWLHVTATLSDGTQVLDSGAVADDGSLDPQAVRFGMTLGDSNGQTVLFHDIARARSVLSDTSIQAGSSRDVDYALPSEAGPLQVTADLLYRSVPQEFVNHYMTPDLRFQVVTMAHTSGTVDARQICPPSPHTPA